MNRALLLFVLAACAAAEPEPLAPMPPLPKPPPPVARGIHLDWTMHVEGEQLRIDYTITNATEARVTVADALPAMRQQNPEVIVVRGDKRADTIAFTRGHVMPESGFRVEFAYVAHHPRFRDIPPGQKLRGVARTRLPLGAYHNFSSAYAIHGPRPFGVLEVDYYDQADVDASNADGAWRKYGRRALRGAIQRLPPGAALASPEEQATRSHGRIMLGCPSPCPDPTTDPKQTL